MRYLGSFGITTTKPDSMKQETKIKLKGPEAQVTKSIDIIRGFCLGISVGPARNFASKISVDVFFKTKKNAVLALSLLAHIYIDEAGYDMFSVNYNKGFGLLHYKDVVHNIDPEILPNWW